MEKGEYDITSFVAEAVIKICNISFEVFAVVDQIMHIHLLVCGIYNISFLQDLKATSLLLVSPIFNLRTDFEES